MSTNLVLSTYSTQFYFFHRKSCPVQASLSSLYSSIELCMHVENVVPYRLVCIALAVQPSSIESCRWYEDSVGVRLGGDLGEIWQNGTM